ncbi:hypothetical protein [Vibrio rotiferianus]|uniref:hypothetical protein n=1 Tax=Vibrio rotiferianus TaxID=190895 RepID=UPI0005EE1B00|nr:hypothetical protein [Vibrio rotiferianus]
MARYHEAAWLTQSKKEILYNINPRDYHDFVIEMMTRVDQKGLKSIYSFLNKNEKLKHLLARCKIENPANLYTTSICARVYGLIDHKMPYENIISWVQMTLESNDDKLNYFLDKKMTFENLRLLSKFEECHAILNDIESKFGYSWWLIESRASLIQDSEGKKSRVKYIRDTINLSNHRGLFYWIAQELNEKNDEKTQENRYCDRVTETFDSLDIPDCLSDHLKFRITRRSNVKIIPTLLIESFGSIIDLYERYTKCCSILVQTNEANTYVVKSIRSLTKKIDCHVLKNCLSRVDKAAKNRKTKSYTISIAARLYLEGFFFEAAEHALSTLKSKPNDLESIMILVFVKDFDIGDSLEGTLLKKIIEDLRDVREFNDSTPEAYSRIRRFTWNNMDLSISNRINSVILNKANLSSVEVTDVNEYYLYADNLDFLTAPLFNLDVCKGISVNKSIRNIKSIIELECKDENELLIKSINSIRKNQCEIINSNNIYLINTLCKSLIKTNDTFSCIRTIVDNSIKNKFLLSILPIQELVEGKRWKEFKNYKDNVELSIVLHFYLILHEDSLQKTNLGFAWDWFRKSLGVLSVSDIVINDDNNIEKEKILYYLSEVSSPETMESHTEGLDTPLQTLISRSQILAKLIELDKSSDKSYEKEQVSLLKTISIQKGLDKLNQNKLYVDENIIKSWAQRELESSYDKFQEILINPELSVSGTDVVSSLDDSDAIISFLNDIVSNRSDEHIHLFNLISNEYLMNKQGGLNLFLSMRIRHGKLESTLRKPLSDSHLITKISEGDIYLDNSYWIEILDIDGDDAEKLNERFRMLSKLFYTQVNEFKEKRIRCLTQSNMLGAFYINPSYNDYYELKTKIASGVNFNTFCDESIKLCRRGIELNLPVIKSLIDKSLINLIIDEINLLLEFSESKGYKPLSEAIKNTRNKFKKTGDIVKEWFNFDDVDVNAKSLTVDDCIDISLANIKNVHSDFTLNFERKMSPKISSLKLSDIDSNNLNEVFYILLDNIYKRSGLKDNVKVRVRIERVNDKNLKITIVNEVKDGVISKSNIDKLDEIRGIISTGLYETKASDEGNSGLIKLKNMNHSEMSSILFDFKFNAFIVKYNFKLL